MSRNLIRDGYKRTTTIKPHVAGAFEPLKITFRPMLPGQYEQMNRDVDAVNSGDGVASALAKHFATHITEWSEVDQGGQMVPITPDVMKMLPPPLMARIKSVISGFEPTDDGAGPLGDEQKN